jgi:hypothetical protein
MSHLIGEGPRQPVIVQCESVSIEGNRCEQNRSHVGCHEAMVDGDSRRWWDWEPETPGELPERRLIVTMAAHEGLSGEWYGPVAGVETLVNALTDADMIEAIKDRSVRGWAAIYLLKHDGKLRELQP